MNNNLTRTNMDQAMKDIQSTNKMCQMLLQSPHYKKIGHDGIFAIIEKAKSVGVDPLDALNGGMWNMRGKIEMSAGMMNQLIRMHKHSITKDKRSNSEICILHGKRADTGDTWTASFSIDDAKLAKIYQNNWITYPQDMLFARALSRLARQLFPDIIKGCYVEDELPKSRGMNEFPAETITVEPESAEVIIEDIVESITDEEFEELDGWLGDNIKLRGNIAMFLKKKYGITDFKLMPRDIFDLALIRAKQQNVDAQQALGEDLQAVGS